MSRIPFFSVGRRELVLGVALLVALAVSTPIQAQQDSLPSWNDGVAKQAILELVAKTTAEGSDSFVAPEDRIATFDQDGTTWVSHPLYGQALFALDRVIKFTIERTDAAIPDNGPVYRITDGPAGAR